MSDLDDPALKQVVSRARRGWTPTAADADRVRQGVGTALSHGLSRVPRAPHPAVASGWMGRVVLTAAFTVAGAGGGYWAGRRADRRRPPAAPASAPAAPVVAPVPPPAAPAVAPAPPPAAPLPAQAPRRIARSHRADLAPPADTPAESLAVEVRGLRNVERALRDHNAGLATAFLDDLDRAVPGGQMREERAALRAIARCTAGAQPFGVSLADEFSAAYPASAYRGRVQQACRGTDSDSSGD